MARIESLHPPMHLMLVQYVLYLPGVASLKEKRGIIKPVLNAIRRDFNVSAAEIDLHDSWQEAALAIVAVGTLRDALEQTEREICSLLDTNPAARVSGRTLEWL